MKKKIALGMSGGVDSSVSAQLLKEQGYEVTGIFLECWRAPGCRTDEDRKDALTVALALDIPFQVLDFKDAYHQSVIGYFFAEYKAGRTPNPDVLCNEVIKFGLFYEWAMKHGFDAVATGHYAQIFREKDRFELHTSADEHKDQTYFLYRLRQEQLPHIAFPIGHLTKKEVRSLAKTKKIAVAEKKDSVGICFLGDINVADFLREELGEKPGEVVDTKGRHLGTHKGLWFYTVGQRHGFHIDTKTVIDYSGNEIIERQAIPPFYVIEKKADVNQLVVGFGEETYRKEFELSTVHWLSEPDQSSELLVRIRHTGDLLSCTLSKNTVQLSQSIQGIAEGQSAVFYQTRKKTFVCLGGGIIELSHRPLAKSL